MVLDARGDDHRSTAQELVEEFDKGFVSRLPDSREDVAGAVVMRSEYGFGEEYGVALRRIETTRPEELAGTLLHEFLHVYAFFKHSIGSDGRVDPRVDPLYQLVGDILKTVGEEDK